MPFHCFWRKSSSYNVTHDFDKFNKQSEKVSISRTRVLVDDDEEITSRRKTVLKSTNNARKSVSNNISQLYLGNAENLDVKSVKPLENYEKPSENLSDTVSLENTTEIVKKTEKDDSVNTLVKITEPKDEKDETNHVEMVKIIDPEDGKDETNHINNSMVKITDPEDEKDETTNVNEEDYTPKCTPDIKSPVTIVIEEPVEDVVEEISNENENNRQDESNTLDLPKVSESISRTSSVENIENAGRLSTDSNLDYPKTSDEKGEEIRRRSGVLPKPIHFDEDVAKSLVKYPKSESDEEFIKNAICRNEFLSKVITGRRLQDVVDAMYLKEIKAKEKIIKEGQRGNHMYVAAEGEFEVTKKGKGVINVMRPGDVFGELAILYNAKRFANVKSITSGKVWVIDGTVYQQLVKKSNNEEQEEIVSFLQNVPILNEAGLEVLRKVASLLKPEFYETGTTIVKEGDRGDKFYIIAAGSVTVTQENNGFVGQLHRGNCFGEKALLEPVTRQATIRADDPGTDCLTLTQKHFVDNFGKIEDISKITMLSPPPLPIPDVKKVVNEYSHLDLSEFKILKTLGVGGFGRVEFIQHKKDPALTFALKCLKKYEMVQQEQQYHVINEMVIQMTCNSPFIIRLYKTFKDNKFIYFLMELCLGGDLWSLLQRQPNKNFTEKGARFIAGCVLEALAYLHTQGFVYRDLKPENLLIDNNGYIKMTDFGFAKHLTPGSKSGTFAGTPEYLAPEIILNRGHDKAVDLWAFGIFVYELLNGKTPFRSNDPSYMKTYNNILNGLDVVFFPPNNTAKARNLITKLLKKAPSERLGVDEIRSHKWFAEFDWERLRSCQMSSPYKPKLSSNVDCRYIDHFRRDNDIPPDENSWWDEYF
ncbi:cGMP-dependent protein kinase 1-like [Harmonia axyridis]|uniref:cGMP-dependent protein kinase 1-like n=1 Tax=Harmonia axyridis TaxID=115357 RepID=UPI001E279246|nr:cGMP-dependent protein kinase 1-like [Harmonia axyridis]